MKKKCSEKGIFPSPQFSEFVENDIEIGKKKALEIGAREENDEIFMKKKIYFNVLCVR